VFARPHLEQRVLIVEQGTPSEDVPRPQCLHPHGVLRRPQLHRHTAGEQEIEGIGARPIDEDDLVGFVEVSQGNFDLFKPPLFLGTGAGQKIRLRAQYGTKLQDYELTFIEPWFLDRKLQLTIDLFYHDYAFLSPNNIFEETHAGAKVGLERALGSEFLRGGITATLEDVNEKLTSSAILPFIMAQPGIGRAPPTFIENPGNVPKTIRDQVNEGDDLLGRFGTSLAYDTRNSVQLPNHGQRTEIDPELSLGDTTYYKIEAKTAWYFPGLFKGHVIEAVGRAGIAASLNGNDVPFYDRYYLGGLYSLRGFKYRNIGPRDPNYGSVSYPNIPSEPIGGDSYWFGSVEYSLPIFEKDNGPGVRFAMFYDAGSVGNGPYSFSGNFDDNWGLGLHINIPKLGPLRLEYGVPIHHDQYNGRSSRADAWPR